MSTSGDDFASEQKRRAAEAGLNLKPSSRMPAPASPEVRLTPVAAPTMNVTDAVFSCRDVSVLYGDKYALSNVSIDVERKQVLAVIGPSGCGKSTFLRCLNR